ncbi:MAG: thioredoxin [endosymbiont of Galathealinum brachiosum]|uniref:Thioredoxin n=1 Tax=endosymbiont of Galathealinum brachiosum TaxID=2200906 RepID=A0A370DNW1_9GAMM|nr:MAG: thioredoxin [endosymbiont of Galathealinum brachiosum]
MLRLQHMQYITDIELLNEMKATGALFILFGGQHCSVCQSIRPQLTSMLEQQFPDMSGVYVDCEKSPEICAQHSVFTLPVVKVYIDGMKIAEEARSFSLKQLAQTIDRPYAMWKDSM